MKIAINKVSAGFQLSAKACRLLERLMGHPVSRYDVDRSDPDVIMTIELLGDEASADPGSIKIVDIPDDVDWVIQEYDGREWVAERHRTWH